MKKKEAAANNLTREAEAGQLISEIMSTDFVTLRPEMTVKEVMTLLRQCGDSKKTIYSMYVPDRQGRLMGELELSDVISAEETDTVASLMSAAFVSVRTDQDSESAARLMSKYDLICLPVTDEGSVLRGIVTYDDIIDVMRAEDTDDIEKQTALTPAEGDYITSNPFRLAGGRLPWLIIMLAGSILTEAIISGFESRLSIAFAACIPMLMDTGGNCGQQALTLTVRALALEEITPKDALRVLWKEFRVSLIVSLVLSVSIFLMQFLLLGRTVSEAFILSFSMLCTVICAKCVGCLLPLLAKRLKLDPALVAAPLITTILDAGSLMILVALVGLLVK